VTSSIAKKHVSVFTDGACLGNPGPGGYAAILVHEPHRREIVGAFRRTTNNRMELMAVIKALEALKQPCAIDLFSDSEYVVNSLSKGWARKWKANGWRRSPGGVVPNWDLWQQLLALVDVHELRVQWVRGHAGHAENERCDALATAAAAANPAEIDAGYETPADPRAAANRSAGGVL
jgi:ribonuclease HI